MNEKPGSSETGHVPRSPGTALYRFLSNKAVMIQRQQTGHQKKDAQSNASISCETKRKGRGLTVETIYKRQNIGMFGESNRRSSLLETSASDIGSCNPTNVANAKYSGFLLFCTSHKKVKFLMVMSQEGEVPTGHPNPLVQINYTFPSIQLKFRFPS
nr:PREDICTED: uncharacterized protein LOC108227639 isoform X1 [Daucus carota subsp. sativus]XP_017258383.1 PREDICTED: uncharacterized protein LOC108227639 isoform X1 [Daucus carota subsp. sativus]XP_017258384.1 PREDICTED: uncharacterized protein LOC108227639 isoform X1 [Daucus carota subsp. sativus]XP_017258385.1 PREDICTED: uncharacterized protein LOC108227639 isoform X1 [Daucus carota subsp. sativus]XP_017258386.1 PREDICTED: uncharacterized protein LOC108227639 isoform X1 [Daucus carota subsp.